MVVCGEEYKPYDNIRKGMDGERLVIAVVKALKFPIEHNPLDSRYGSYMGHGADIAGNGPLRGLLQIEVKNWNGKRRVSKDDLKREVTGGYVKGKLYKSRFTPGCKNKVLVWFGGNFISQPNRDLIKSCGIRLVELPQQILGYSKSMFKALLDKLMFLKYKFKTKLREFFSSLNSRFNSRFDINHIGVDVLGRVYTPIRNTIEFGTQCIKIRSLDPVQRKITRWGDVLS